MGKVLWKQTASLLKTQFYAWFSLLDVSDTSRAPPACQQRALKPPGDAVGPGYPLKPGLRAGDIPHHG